MDRPSEGRQESLTQSSKGGMASREVYQRLMAVNRKVILSPMTVMERPCSVTFTHPGLTWAMMGRDGEPSLPQLFALCSELRMTGLLSPCRGERAQPQGHNDFVNGKKQSQTSETGNRSTQPQNQSDAASHEGARNQVDHWSGRGQTDASEVQHTETLLGWPNASSEMTEFVAVTELQLSRALCSPEVAQSVVKARVGLGSLQTSSLLTTLELTTPGKELLESEYGASTPFLRHLLKVVCVDLNSRKSRPFPEDFRKKFQGLGSMEKENFWGERFAKPTHVYSRSLEIVYSDTDPKYHTNYASYVRFAMDTLHKAFLERRSAMERKTNDVTEEKAPMEKTAGTDDVTNKLGQIVFQNEDNLTALNQISDQTIQNGVKNVKVCYFRESRINDVIVVKAWAHSDHHVRFCLESPTGQAHSQIAVEYFTTPAKL